MLGLLDARVATIVAEIDEGVSPTLSRDSGERGELVEESWKTLE